MGISGGPQIIRDTSLVLALEASDQNSNNRYQGRNWIDLSGNNTSGSIINGPSLNNDSYGSFNFNGINSYISISNPVSFQSQNISISVWVYPLNPATSLVTLIDYDHGSLSGWTIQSENATTNRNYYFAYHDGTQFQPTGNFGSGKGVQITNSIWNNIVYTKNGTSVIGYVNGIETVNYTASNSNINYQPNKNFRIGDFVNSSNRFFSGSISTVQIYNRALSATEIQFNYNQYKTRFNRTTPNIVTYTSLNTTTAIESFNDVLEFTNVLVGYPSYESANAVALVNETP
jgi:hypothetical protein